MNYQLDWKKPNQKNENPRELGNKNSTHTTFDCSIIPLAGWNKSLKFNSRISRRFFRKFFLCGHCFLRIKKLGKIRFFFPEICEIETLRFTLKLFFEAGCLLLDFSEFQIFLFRILFTFVIKRFLLNAHIQRNLTQLF